ncbi:hypothetical protein Gpo141_00005335 [Globisporangium polare]
MMRISDILNSGDHSDEEEVAQIIDAHCDSASAKLRRTTSATQYNNVHPRHGYEEEDSSSGGDDTGRLSETTSFASSLLDALSLQSMAKLSSKRSPTVLNSSPLGSESSAQNRYLTIQHLTNPQGMGEMKQEGVVEEDDQFAADATAANDQQATSSKKRSTRALFPSATDSDRRAKQRMIVKRCYYKKITLRDEVQTLEDQFHAAMQSRKQQNEAIAAASTNKEEEEATKLSDLYIQSLTAKESLRKENQRLRRLADEYYMKNQGRLRILLDSNKKGITLFTPALEE